MQLRPLMIVAVPPPIGGQSIASRILLQEFADREVRFEVIDLSGRHFGDSTIARVIRLLKMHVQLSRRLMGLRKRDFNVAYLQLGQSPLALIRDASLLARLRHARIPVVIHLHGSGLKEALEGLRGPLRRVVASEIRGCSAAIVLSASLSSQFSGLLPEARIAVVPNGVDPEIQAQAHGYNSTSESHLLNVLFLSNLIESKGYICVLETARCLQRFEDRIRFTIAGAVTDQSTVDPTEYIRQHELKNVDYVGPVYGARKADLIASSDVLAFPTRYPLEGQPMVILEAFQFGVAVVSTRRGGIPDIVEHGANGVLLSGSSPEELARVLESFLSNPALLCRLRQGSRDSSGLYSPVRHVDKLASILERYARPQAIS